jgi:hypothetical protein
MRWKPQLISGTLDMNIDCVILHTRAQVLYFFSLLLCVLQQFILYGVILFLRCYASKAKRIIFFEVINEGEKKKSLIQIIGTFDLLFFFKDKLCCHT